MMLGRTAANLFWLSRYVERAENIARLLEAGVRMSLIRRPDQSESEYLTSMLQAAACDQLFFAKYETAELRTVAQFMMLDPENPSSVYSCFHNARTNARTERTALTSDMWEAIKLGLARHCPGTARPGRRETASRPRRLGQACQPFLPRRPAPAPSSGTTVTLSPSLGNFVERADNTARILDMKYYVLLPRSSFVGGEIDIQQWTLILRGDLCLFILPAHLS